MKNEAGEEEDRARMLRSQSFILYVKTTKILSLDMA